MKLVLVGGTKGGPGKSTLCVELSVEAGRRGGKVLVIDGNGRQGSATDWLAHRRKLVQAAIDGVEEGMPKGVSMKDVSALSVPDVETLDSEGFWSELGGKVSNYDWVFFDVPGYDSKEIKSALAVVDVALFPLKLSVLDMRTAGKIDARIGEYLSGGFPLRKAMWVLNEATPPSVHRNPPADEEEIAEALRQNFNNLSVADQRIALRKPFRKAPWGGYCVSDGLHPNENSWINGRNEIRGLFDEMTKAFTASLDKKRAA